MNLKISKFNGLQGKTLALIILVVVISCLLLAGEIFYKAPMIIPVIVVVYLISRLLEEYLGVKSINLQVQADKVRLELSEHRKHRTELTLEWVEELDRHTRETMVDYMLSSGGVTIDLTTQHVPPSLKVLRTEPQGRYPDDTTVEVVLGSTKVRFTYQQYCYMSMMFAGKAVGLE